MYVASLVCATDELIANEKKQSISATFCNPFIKIVSSSTMDPACAVSPSSVLRRQPEHSSQQNFSVGRKGLVGFETLINEDVAHIRGVRTINNNRWIWPLFGCICVLFLTKCAALRSKNAWIRSKMDTNPLKMTECPYALAFCKCTR